MINNTKNNNAVENDIAIDTIIATIQPEAIYRLPAANNNSDMELIVVIPDTVKTLFKHYEAILELVGIQHLNDFRYWLHNATQLHQLLVNKTPFYLDSCITSNRIYDNGSHKLPIVTGKQKTTATENAITGFTTAYGKALTFMDGARQLAQQENHTMAAFMLHQCIELSLHAVIQAFTGQDKASHSISALLEHVQQYTHAFDHLFRAGTNGKNEVIEILELIHQESRDHTNATAGATQWLTRLFEKATEVLETTEQTGKKALQS